MDFPPPLSRHLAGSLVAKGQQGRSRAIFFEAGSIFLPMALGGLARLPVSIIIRPV
jgi:hypothetical protein